MSGSMLTVSGSITELDSAWSSWLERIPAEERDKVAEIIVDADLSTMSGINKLAKMFVVEMIRGNVSPVVASAAKPWIELMIFNIQQMNMAAGNPEGARADAGYAFQEIVAAVRQLKPLQPKYTVRELPESIDAPELETRERLLVEGS